MLNEKMKRVVFIGMSVSLAISLGMNVKDGLTDTIEKEGVVATVGSEKVTQVELYRFLLDKAGKQGIETLVSNELVKQESDKKKLKPTEKEIDAEYKKVVTQYGGEEQLEAQLKKDGSSVKSFKEDIKTFILTNKLVEPSVKVTDKEIEAHFNENKDKYQQSEKVQASHILVKDKDKIDKLYKELQGKDLKEFAKVAKKESEDEGTAKEGGQLGFFDDKQMDEAFTKVAFKTKVNTMSKPVKSAFGWHLVYVTGKQDKKEVTIDTVRDVVKEELKQSKLPQAYSDWLEDKKKEYKVENKISK